MCFGLSGAPWTYGLTYPAPPGLMELMVFMCFGLSGWLPGAARAGAPRGARGDAPGKAPAGRPRDSWFDLPGPPPGLMKLMLFMCFGLSGWLSGAARAGPPRGARGDAPPGGRPGGRPRDLWFDLPGPLRDL